MLNANTLNHADCLKHSLLNVSMLALSLSSCLHTAFTIQLNKQCCNKAQLLGKFIFFYFIAFTVQDNIIEWKLLCYFHHALAIKVQEFEGRRIALPWCDQWQQQNKFWKLNWCLLPIVYIHQCCFEHWTHLSPLWGKKKKNKIARIGLLTGSQNCSVRQRKTMCLDRRGNLGVDCIKRTTKEHLLPLQHLFFRFDLCNLIRTKTIHFVRPAL